MLFVPLGAIAPKLILQGNRYLNRTYAVKRKIKV